MDAGTANGYSWGITGSGSTQTIQASTSGDYSVRVVDSDNRPAYDTVNVTITGGPTININTSSTTVCSGDPVTLTASGANTYS